MFRDHAPCVLCGGEVTPSQGCTSCVECGTVAEEILIGDDTFEAMTRCCPADVHVVKKRRKIDRFGGMKARVTSYVEHAMFGSAVSAQCIAVLDVLPPLILRDSDLDAWTVIMLGCELAKSSRPMDDLARRAGVATGRLINRGRAMKMHLATLFKEEAADQGDANEKETVTAMNTALTAIYGVDRDAKKTAARRHVLKRLAELEHYAPFMNMKPKTQARALIVEHLKAIGHRFSVQDRAALDMGSTAMRNGLNRLNNAVPSS